MHKDPEHGRSHEPECWVQTLTPAGLLENETCLWASDGNGVWTSDCHRTNGDGPSFAFDDGGPVENGFSFCPYCGKPLLASRFPGVTHVE